MSLVAEPHVDIMPGALPQRKRDLAARDQVTDEQFYVTLETLVADHRQACE